MIDYPRFNRTGDDLYGVRFEAYGLSRSAFLRQLICGIQPKELPPPDFRPMMRQLYYCGNNLNQIARKANALNLIDVQHYEEAVKLFRQTIIEINKVLINPE